MSFGQSPLKYNQVVYSERMKSSEDQAKDKWAYGQRMFPCNAIMVWIDLSSWTKVTLIRVNID